MNLITLMALFGITGQVTQQFSIYNMYAIISLFADLIVWKKLI